MNSGRLRHRLAIQSKTEGRDTRGGVTETWATVATRWGSIEPLRMREVFEAQQLDARVTHRILLRYYVGLTNQHRLLHGSRVFHVHEVLNPGERDKATTVLAMEET